MGCWWFDESHYPGPPEPSTYSSLSAAVESFTKTVVIEGMYTSARSFSKAMRGVDLAVAAIDEMADQEVNDRWHSSCDLDAAMDFRAPTRKPQKPPTHVGPVIPLKGKGSHARRRRR